MFLFNTIFQIKLNLPIIRGWGNTRPHTLGFFDWQHFVRPHTVRLHEDALTIVPLGHSIRRKTTVPSGGASVTAFTGA